jgi:hypothetical protein
VAKTRNDAHLWASMIAPIKAAGVREAEKPHQAHNGRDHSNLARHLLGHKPQSTQITCPLKSTAAQLREREVDLLVLKQGIDTSTPGGRLQFHMFGAFDEFLRELIVEGTLEGLTSARARGRVGGRPGGRGHPRGGDGPCAV